MLGTVVNAAAIMAGGLLGLFIKNNMPERYKDMVNHTIGLAVLFVGLSSSLGKLLLPEANPVVFIISLVVGGIAGERMDIEGRLEKLGALLESRFPAGGGSVAHGFVSASLLFCVGTMAILGSLESGIAGVHNILFAKSVLDGVTSVIFAATLGIGVLFSAASVFVYQGAITLLARVVAPWLTTAMINEISIVGGILIAALGLKMLGIKETRVGNMLPAILLPVVYLLVAGQFAG